MVAVRAYPKLPLRNPSRSSRNPEPTGSCSSRTTRGPRTGHSERFVAHADVSEAETLLELPDMAYSLCFHPRYPDNGFSTSVATAPDRVGNITRESCATRCPESRRTASSMARTTPSSSGHPTVTTAPRPLRKRRHALRHVRRRHLQSDSDVVGQDRTSLRSKVLRLDVDDAPPASRTACRLTIRSQPRRRAARDMGLRASQSVAHHVRPRERPDLGRGERSGPSRIRPPDRARCELRLERVRGHASVLAWQAARAIAVTPPTIEHGHAAFRSLTGGFVYRGRRFPELTGAYLYGDYGTGRVWAARHDGTRLLWNRELADTPLAIAGFGTTREGDILFADHLGNAIHRLEPAPSPVPGQPAFPTMLSDTGLFASTAAQPAAGVQPYEINASAWHDGAGAERWLALPELTSAELPPPGDAAGPWKSGASRTARAVAQTLTLPAAADRPARRVETRILLKQGGETGLDRIHLSLERRANRRRLGPEGRQTTRSRPDAIGTSPAVPTASPVMRAGQLRARSHHPQLNRDRHRRNDAKSDEALVRPGLTPTARKLAGSRAAKTAAQFPRLVDPYDPNALDRRASASFGD